MTSDDDNLKVKEGEVCVDVSQLRPGMHVRLPVQWMEHQFMFNSFVITDHDQIQQIQAMNLPKLFCDITRCKMPPLPKQQTPESSANQPSEGEKARLAVLKAKQIEEKMERAKVLTRIRELIDKTHNHYAAAAKFVGNAIKSFDSNPMESIQQVNLVSEKSTALLMEDVDSAIVLIAEKGHSDGAVAHALSVMTLSLLLGKQARLPGEALKTLGVGALLHDIGKSTINTSILRNQERNKHENAIYMTHCRIGYESALRAGGLPQSVLDAILRHHEHYDGKGFPDKLSGDEIPISARVIAIADRFDNLVNPLDYRRAMSPSEVLSTMWVKEKKAFDPLLLQLFIRAMGVYPPGSVVQLSDERVGVVMVSASTEIPLSPQVLIYEPDMPRHHAIIIDLAKDTSVKIDHALRLQDRSNEELDYLLPRRKMSWFHSKGQ